MLSHSPKISLPSSGSSGKEATGPSLQPLSPALGPAREHCRVPARMNKSGSSASKDRGKQPPPAGLARAWLWLSEATWLPCAAR